MSTSTPLALEICERDGISLERADRLVKDAQQRVYDGEDPEEILHREFGLEPDFVVDLTMVF